jgi:hypothetical protein
MLTNWFAVQRRLSPSQFNHHRDFCPDHTVLHTFSALDANAHNEDGANPLRTVVILFVNFSGPISRAGSVKLITILPSFRQNESEHSV